MQTIINVKGANGAYLGGSSIRVQSKDGYGDITLQPLSAGNFAIDLAGGDFANVDPSTIILTASAPGYQSVSVSGANLQPENDFILAKANYVTPLLIGGAIAAVAAIALSKSKKKVAGFETLPPAAKTAIVLGGVGVVAWLILKGGKPSGQALADKASVELQELAKQGIYPTFSNTQAEAYAGELRSAFNDCGTDEDSVMSVMNAIQNQADIVQLVSVYGTRGYKGCFDSGNYFSDVNYNLAEAMTSELSSSYIAAINSGFAAKGISFKF